MLLAERQAEFKMRKEISIKEFMTKLNEKGIEHMLFHGGTSELFGVENIKEKKVYLDDHSNIILTDKKLVPCMGAVTHVWDKRLIISRIEEAGLDKNPALINEKNLKDLFEVDHDGRLYIKEDDHGRLLAMAGFELEA